jgi:hypothetical protein
VPTPENTQAWSFVCNNDELGIYWQSEKGHHFFDQLNHAACITFGCLLEYIDIAAHSLHFGVKLKSFHQQAFNGGGPVARLSLYSSRKLGAGLESVLSTRSTNRGLFKPQKLPEYLSEELCSLVSDFPHLEVAIKENFSSGFTKALCRMEAEFFSYPEYLRDLLKNIVFSRKERHKLKSGIYQEELGLKFFEKIPLFLAKKFSFFRKILPFLGIKFFVRAHSRKIIKSSQFLVIGTTQPGHESLIEVGRVGTRAWLMLNSRGFAVQPMTALALQVYELNTQRLPSFISGKHKNLLQNVSQNYADELNMAYPVWVLRFGQACTRPKATTGPSLRNDLILQKQTNLQSDLSLASQVEVKDTKIVAAQKE